MSTNQPGAAGNGAPIAILTVIFGGGALLAGGWLGGTIGAAAAGAGWAPPPFTLASVKELLVGGGPSALWPQAPGAAVAGIVVLFTAALVGGGLAAWAIYQRVSRPRGLANRRDVQALTPKPAAERARALRPSLKDVREIAPADRGLLIGDLDPSGPELRGSDEDTVTAVMAPRAGKTTALAVPIMLEAPGAALLTSNKADAYAITRRARSRVGTALTLDPQGVAYAEREMWVDLLADARTIEGAGRLASHFAATAADAAKMDFWMQAAKNTLSALFHAAAISGAEVRDVLAWLATPSDRAPVNALRGHNDAMADQLASTVAGAVETRDGIYETARQAVACLLDPKVAAWVTPDRSRTQFKPHEFVTSKDTLYLLSKNGGGSAAGVIAAVTDSVIRAGVAAGEAAGGRLPTPLRAILDEAANVCRIEDLPELYSHLGSRGITPITILQSYRQGVRVWGEPGMDSLWSASTIKLIGAGTDDANFAENVSRLIGEHKVRETSVSYGSGGRSTSTSRQRERILEAGQVRALPKGRGLLLATGTPVAMVKLRPWYAEPYARTIGPDTTAEEAAIAQRAAKKAFT